MSKSQKLTLALQGGGTHGAFTWGVLDRLLDEKRLHITAVSGTSAGALNAALMASGMASGGTKQAQQLLYDFWKGLSEAGASSPFSSSWINPFQGPNAPFVKWLDSMMNFVSPYEFNPFNINPLRDLLEHHVDIGLINKSADMKLYISATNVKTNRLRIFSNGSITVDALLASSCLPRVHHAVMIDGDPYWDGGFMGNPTLEPLVHKSKTGDILVVQLNPTHCEHTPVTAEDIANRINDITFNSSLMREIRNIVLISNGIESGDIIAPHLHKTYLHLISAEDVTSHLSAASKFDTQWDFLVALRDHGRSHADNWLQLNGKHIGHKSTLDLGEWHEYISY